MTERASATQVVDDNVIPTGLPGGFFIYEADEDQQILFAERNIIDLFGCATLAEFRAHTHNSFRGMVHPDDLAKIENEITAQTLTGERRHDYVRYRIVTRQGEVRYVEDFGHLLVDAAGKRFFYVFIVDVDKNEYHNRSRNSYAESQVLSSLHGSDRLTGLANMRSFYEEVQELLDSEKMRRQPLSFAHFDILSFKVFNEEYGFQRGDDLLCRMALVLRGEFPEGKVARFSNDHFVVCCALDKDEMGRHVTQVHNAMARILDGIRVEIKAGIYELDDSCREVGIACDRARLACNTVKHRYDRVFGTYDVGLYERLRLQQYVVDTVGEATEKGFIKVYYQPIVRVATGRICGYEALARWDDPKMGFLPPSQFIGTLEEFHMTHIVDCRVIEQVCEDLALLIERGEPVVPVSVNLSRLDFELCDIFEITERYRMRYDLPRSLMDIEITESALNGDSALLYDAVARFRNAGYRVWVDDFGSGYSALNSLLAYDFDVLKLDLEFMRTYDEHKGAGKLITHIVQGAKSLGVQPLQEGVETAEHLAFLREIGCEMAQGYYFARPMELEESRRETRERGFGWE